MDEVRILVIDDEPMIQQIFHRALSTMGHQVDVAAAGRKALERLSTNSYDIVVLDVQLPDIHGLHLLSRIKELYPFLEVLVMTGYATIDLAVEAMRLGAFHFLTKPVASDEIRQNIKNMLEKINLRREIHLLRWQLSEQCKFHELLGRSLAMQEVFMLIKKVAASLGNVLIAGESGTGKELAARAIHAESPRKDAPFVVINCSALAEGTLESELFGHEKGSFTGAYRNKTGFFQEAEGGTIFLDEVGSLRPSTQVLLLRVIQEKEFHPVGSTNSIKSDTRLIAATNTSLERLVGQKKFRDDLYYRLNVVTINLPPLRKRGEDVFLLMEYFIKKFSEKQNRQIEGISSEAQQILKEYNWPGNVRELENVCERAVMMADSNMIHRMDLPDYLLNISPFIQSFNGESESNRLSYFLYQEPNFKRAKRLWNSYFERKFISRVLKKTNGSVTLAAEEIGMARPALQRLMKKYQIKREFFKPENV